MILTKSLLLPMLLDWGPHFGNHLAGPSKDGSGTSRLGITWELVRNDIFWPQPDLLNQNLGVGGGQNGQWGPKDLCFHSSHTHENSSLERV